MEGSFPYVLQHMDASSKISKWIIQLQEFDYSVMIEDSTRANLENFLTHQYKERKKQEKPKEQANPPIKELEDAFSLYFDGAFKQNEGQAVAKMVVFNPLGEVLMKRGMVLQDVSSNNEVEYAALTMGLESCVSNNINCLNVYGDYMLIVKHVQET